LAQRNESKFLAGSIRIKTGFALRAWPPIPSDLSTVFYNCWSRQLFVKSHKARAATLHATEQKVLRHAAGSPYT